MPSPAQPAAAGPAAGTVAQACVAQPSGIQAVDGPLRLLQDLVLAATAAGTASDALVVAMARLCELPGWTAAHYYQVAAEEPPRLLPTGLWHLDDPEAARALVAATRGRVFARGEGLPGRVLASGEAEWIRDVRKAGFPRQREAGELGVAGVLGVPVLVGDRVVGVLELFSPVPLEPDPRLLGLTCAVGVLLGQVVERERTHQELHRQRELVAAAERRECDLLREQVRRSEVESERRRLYRLFQEAPASIVFTRGPRHVIELANRRVEEENPGVEFAGRPLAEALPAAAEQGFVELLDRVFASGEPHVGREVQVLRATEAGPERRFADFVFQPIHDSGGEVQGVLIHAVDVTEQVQARREVERKAGELERLAARLSKSNRDLDQFAYIASHDLRAPLRGISNLAQWLEEELAGRLDGETRHYLELLRGRVARMEALIDGILQYSRAGRLDVTPERVDLGELVRETVELIDPPDGAVVEIAPGLPVLETARAPLAQVFLNLVGNALKYARRANPRVEVSGREVGGGVWELAVRDNGPGIPPEYQDKVWQIFQTLEARDEAENTGIGLAVVRKLVEDRGGTVAIDSDPDREPGTTFRFTWPAFPVGDTP